MPKHYLACDLGAESGRVMLGILGDGSLRLEEIHRFANVPIRHENSLHWNIPNLVLELKEGLRKAAKRNLPLESISTDSWGLDYLLFDKAGRIIDPTFHYRDPRTSIGIERTFARVPWEEVFAETGIQFMPINTIYQLAAESRERLDQAEFLLGIADGLNYFLSGVRKMDVTMASTFQLYNPRERNWSAKLTSALDFPARIFPELIPPGTLLAPLRAELATELDLPSIPVIATCSHDTAAAVAGVPAQGDDWAYISSGTWSLLGVELQELVINDRCRELNFTNEIGYGDTIRLLKNVSGMWLVQECRRAWLEQGWTFSYEELGTMSAGAEPFRTLISPMSPEFLAPKNMPEAIASFCKAAGEPVPRCPAEFVRATYESLALLYAYTLQQVLTLTGKEIKRLHIVGGGSNNALLNQFTADATGLPVYAGPAEATTIGNVLLQAITTGSIGSLQEGRQIVNNSASMRKFDARDSARWSAQYGRFLALNQKFK
jgi:rhamnulokinase